MTVLQPSGYPEEFEQGLRSKELRLPYCGTCRRFHWYPMSRCPHCLSGNIAWRGPGGVATVFTCSTVSHAFHPDWEESVPYTVVLVEYSGAPGVRLVAQLLEENPGGATIGALVEPVFLESNSIPRLAFRAAGRKGTE